MTDVQTIGRPSSARAQILANEGLSSWPRGAGLSEEFAKGQDARSSGIRERLAKAKAFYAELQKKMSA